MGRPRKQTVDYFPHMCTHGKTMFILEQRYGNDGYCFWFKLLESLGSSEGHFLNCSDTATWEFLASKARLQKETCIEILDLLAGLEAISPDLWVDKIIWSDNFIVNITEAYRNRKVEIPKKPDFLRKKSIGEIETEKTKEDITSPAKPSKKRQLPKLTDEQWWQSIYEDPDYSQVDFTLQNKLMDKWLLDHPGRTKNRTFIRNWLNKLIPVKPSKLQSLDAAGRELAVICRR